MQIFNNFNPNTDIYMNCINEFQYADTTIFDLDKRRDYKAKAFCELLKYHSKTILEPLAESNLDPAKIPKWIDLDKDIYNKLIEFAINGTWLDEAFSTYYKDKLENCVDSEFRRRTYDINGNLCDKPNKTHNYNLRPRPIVKKQLNQ